MENNKPTGEGDRVPRGLFPPGRALPSDERVVMLIKPSLVWVFLRTPRRLTVLAVVLLVLLVWGWVLGRGLWGFGAELVGFGVLVLAVQVAWNVLQYEARWYAMTESRVLAIGGVLGRFSTEVPLEAVRGLVVVRPWLERALGVGGVGFGSAATGGMEVVWIGVRGADEIADRVRGEIAKLPGGKMVEPTVTKSKKAAKKKATKKKTTKNVSKKKVSTKKAPAKKKPASKKAPRKDSDA